MFKDGALSHRDFAKAASAFGVTFLTVPMANRASADGGLTYFGWAAMTTRPLSQVILPDMIRRRTISSGAPKMKPSRKCAPAAFQPDVMALCTYELFKWNDARLLKAMDTTP